MYLLPGYLKTSEDGVLFILMFIFNFDSSLVLAIALKDLGRFRVDLGRFRVDLGHSVYCITSGRRDGVEVGVVHA